MKVTLLFFVGMLLVGQSMQAQNVPAFDIQGHRGARGLMPENTIPAFLMALDSGVTTLELDLAVTLDQLIVVSHEPWMSATICTDPNDNNYDTKNERNFNIYQMSYLEVKAFDCGSKVNEKFPEQKKLKVSKPLLQDVIVAVENHIRNYSKFEVDYNIEIKTSPEGDGKFHPNPEKFSDMVFNLVDQYLPLSRIIIQSFDFRVLRYWHSKYPQVRLSMLIEKGTVEENLTRLGFDPNIYSPYYKILNKESVKSLQLRKVKVIPWTVNEVVDMLSMKGLGVDGFITDYPNRTTKIKHTLNISRGK